MDILLRAFTNSSSAFIFGATVWFFFVQSVYLVRKVGRERFVPLQMMMTKILFQSLLLASVVLAIGSMGSLGSLISLASVSINLFVILPKAFAAGGSAMREYKEGAPEGSAASFANYGAGQSTKLYHRLVVFFVVTMLAGLLFAP